MSTRSNPTASIQEMNLAYEEACEDFFEKVSAAQVLCGGDAQEPSTAEQRRAVQLMDESEERCRQLKDALDKGEHAAFQEQQRVWEKAERERVVQEEAAAQQAAAQETPAPAPAAFPMNFDQVTAVVELSRRLAIQDYTRHLHAVVLAENAEAKAVAVEQLHKAEKAARLADSTYQSLMTALAEQRATTVALIRGDDSSAEHSAKAASQHLEIVADKLDRYGLHAPKSRFFQTSMNALVKADAVAGRVETAVERKVEAFTAGMKGVALRVQALAQVVARTPAVVHHMAKSTGISIAQAATTAFESVSFRLGSIFRRAEHKAQAAATSAKESAWDILDSGADLIGRMGDRLDQGLGVAQRAVASVDLHTRATVGLAGGLLARVGAAVKEGYAEQVNAVEEQRSVRRAKPR